VPKTSLFDRLHIVWNPEQLKVEIEVPKHNSISKSHYLLLTLTYEPAIQNLHELERRARPFVESSVSAK